MRDRPLHSVHWTVDTHAIRTSVQGRIQKVELGATRGLAGGRKSPSGVQGQIAPWSPYKSALISVYRIKKSDKKIGQKVMAMPHSSEQLNVGGSM